MNIYICNIKSGILEEQPLYYCFVYIFHQVGFRRKKDDGLSRELTSTMGMKQGCPLLPTPFSLRIDQLEEFILEASVNMGKIQPSTLQNTIYDLCDNIVLLTYSKLILLKVFDTIHNTVHLCEHNVLAVNVLHQSHGCNHYQIGM
mgnify:FL=1